MAKAVTINRLEGIVVSDRPHISIVHPLAGDERGATAVEYGLVLALITLASLAALTDMAGTTVGIWTKVAAKVTNAS